MTKFVYFDLGGVVELDFSGTHNWSLLKRELGIIPETDQEFEAFWSDHLTEICTSRDVDTLLPLMKQKFGTQVSPGYSLLLDGFVNRFLVNPSIWPVIDYIHSHNRIGLLTDMYPGMLNAIKKRSLLPPIVWDVIVDSSIEGLKKPDPQIFRLAESKTGAAGLEILFVENTPTNVTAATEFGWHAFLYDSTHPKASSQKLLQCFQSLNP